MDEPSIRSEMHKIAQDGIAAGEVITLDAIVHAVLETRDDIEGDDAPFYRVNAFDNLKRIAKTVVGKYDAKDTTDADVLLLGFEHLCKAYPMMRDRVVALVPVDQCTDIELYARAAQLDEMAKGCVAHAIELREFVRTRSQRAA